MTLEAFNELAASSIEVDHLIDAELERIEQEEDNFVIDSHLAFHFVPIRIFCLPRYITRNGSGESFR